MHHSLGIAVFSLFVSVVLVCANADEGSSQVDNAEGKPAASDAAERGLRPLRGRQPGPGAGQPTAKAAQEQIERRGDGAADTSADDPLDRFHSVGKEMTKAELREAVGILIERVLRLEAEVRQLQKNPPQIELLR